MTANSKPSIDVQLKILVVDDHHLVREGVRLSLRQLDRDVTVIEAESVNEAIDAYREHPDTDLVLMDLGLPGQSGIQALDALYESCPDAKVVVLSARHDYRTVRLALERGVSGFIPKMSGSAATLNALRFVLNGDVYVPPEMFLQQQAEISASSNAPAASTRSSLRPSPRSPRRASPRSAPSFSSNAVAESSREAGATSEPSSPSLATPQLFTNPLAPTSPAQPATAPRELVVPPVLLATALPVALPTPKEAGLTPRQIDVLQLLLAGKSNRQICVELELRLGTVKSHVAAILQVLDAGTRIQAVTMVEERGWRDIIEREARSSRAASPGTTEASLAIAAESIAPAIEPSTL